MSQYRQSINRCAVMFALSIAVIKALHVETWTLFMYANASVVRGSVSHLQSELSAKTALHI